MTTPFQYGLNKGKLLRDGKLFCTKCGNAYQPSPYSRTKYKCPLCEPEGKTKDEKTVNLLVAHGHLLDVQEIANILDTTIGGARQFCRRHGIKPKRRTRKNK